MRRAAERGARRAADSGNRGGMGRTRKLYKDLSDVYTLQRARVYSRCPSLHAPHTQMRHMCEKIIADESVSVFALTD